MNEKLIQKLISLAEKKNPLDDKDFDIWGGAGLEGIMMMRFILGAIAGKYL